MGRARWMICIVCPFLQCKTHTMADFKLHMWLIKCAVGGAADYFLELLIGSVVLHDQWVIGLWVWNSVACLVRTAMWVESQELKFWGWRNFLGRLQNLRGMEAHYNWRTLLPRHGLPTSSISYISKNSWLLLDRDRINGWGVGPLLCYFRIRKPCPTDH